MANLNLSVACAAAKFLSNHMSETNRDVKDVFLDQETQEQYLNLKRAECDCKMETDSVELTGVYCSRVWDDVMCWDDTPEGTTATQPCPFYVNKFTTQGFASKVCLSNGTWYNDDAVGANGTENGWTDFTQCVSGTVLKPPMEVPSIIREHLMEFRIMYNVGYGLSLVFLVFAMIIMIYFKKLHCSRNTIHMNLFVSFIFRAFINLIRDNFVVEGVGFPKDLVFNDSGAIVSFKEGSHWECKLFFSVFQYAVAASYMWIFVEAIYIHMLIFVSVFTERIKVIWFMVTGWSIPFVFVLIWSIARLTLDNTLCWNTTKNNPGLTWILKGPIMLTVVINFFFFISLVWILYTKLSASPEVKKSKYRTLARSTLFLIPVFGVYYIVFTLPLSDVSDTVESIMLFIEMFFNSYQGVFIAVILCFINAEVRAEIRKFRVQRQLRRGSTGSTVVRCSKMKFKRETIAPCENTDFSMPMITVENGTLVPASKQKEDEPFLEVNKSEKCDTIRLYNNMQSSNVEDTCVQNETPLHDINCKKKQSNSVEKELEMEVLNDPKLTGCDNAGNDMTNGVSEELVHWNQERVSRSNKT